ncbi:hypothetical protein G6F57_002692 [Rhizopus arrhizus]|uniref:Uncharacterized protein n=1 Tax=Rhizopus oryzae TaxID=64495 RepID=A0A9P6X5J5_RHIOR|nr:hypothetical protein G6F23_004006 [Rhizopus arrhizus]KAG0764209.1 hypothetical protein G6F24_005402 [Rhizopus arrhizus]KAG0787091.1 hypothetical protein G6F21_008144 [Rhizopus arrhizus]KAG0800310.1 hypothetical protein G6F22_002356 [Rhizopus arrhizus]KAG0809283.1 hypothetical protein G6F20_008897 [Rhizopus arrhizus]
MNQTKKLSILSNKSSGSNSSRSKTKTKSDQHTSSTQLKPKLKQPIQTTSRRPSQTTRPASNIPSPKSPLPSKSNQQKSKSLSQFVTTMRKKSLSATSSKVQPKEEPLLIPWKQYDMTKTSALNYQVNYPTLLQELNMAYATLETSGMNKIMDCLEVSKLQKKSDHVPALLDSLYNHIRLQVDIQRATLAYLKLENLQISTAYQAMCDMYKKYTQLEQSIDDFYFTSKSAYNLRSSHPKHAEYTQIMTQKTPKDHCLYKVLMKLEKVVATDMNQSERSETDYRLSLSSTSSTPSSFSSTTKPFSNKTSITSIFETEESTVDVQQRIDFLIDKLAHKQDKNELSEKNSDSAKASDSHEALSKELNATRELLIQEQQRTEQLKETLDQKETLLSKQQKQMEQLQITLDASVVRQTEMEKKEIALETQVRKLEAQCSDRHQLEIQLDDYKMKHRQLETKMDELQRELERRIEERDFLTKVVSEMKQKDEDEARLNSAEHEIDDMLEELETVNQKEHQIHCLQRELEEVKRIYLTRESGFLLQSASIEAELEKILKEYDRLTRNIMDFNNERKNLEYEIDKLKQEKYLLQHQLFDQKARSLDDGQGQTHVLRKEFRQLMQHVKEKHLSELLEETESKKKLEQELRNLKAEVEMKRWDRVHTAVQTHFDMQFIRL